MRLSNDAVVSLLKERLLKRALRTSETFLENVEAETLNSKIFRRVCKILLDLVRRFQMSIVKTRVDAATNESA